jgi:hemolysin III
MNSARRQTPGEELANSLTHAAGLVGSIIGTPFLLIGAVRHGDSAFILGTSVFCAAMILLYSASSVYHALPAGPAKRLFFILDHSAIFLLIAGTYTPFTLGVLRDSAGWILFGIVWGLALVGMTLKAFGKAGHPLISTGLYLAMGWVVLFALGPLIAAVPPAGIAWLLAGGLSYTLGVAFFITDAHVPYGHMVWHAFVVAGTACHYFAVLWYAA